MRTYAREPLLLVIVVEEAPVVIRLLVVKVALLGLALHEQCNDEAQNDAAEDEADDAHPVAEEPREEVSDRLHAASCVRR